MLSTCDLIVIIVPNIKRKNDLLQPWEVLAFDFNSENLIKNDKILAYLFLSFRSIE